MAHKAQLSGTDVLNPLTLKISLVILLTVCHTVLVMLVWRIWDGINLLPLIDIFPSSQHLSSLSLMSLRVNTIWHLC